MHRSQPATPHKKSVFRRVVRILVKVVLTVIIILIIVVFLIQTPYVQNIVRGKAEKYLSRKLNTRVNIGHLYVGFPRTIVLNDVYIGDRQKDTLLSAGLISVDIRMWQLLHKEVDIQAVHLADLTVKVKRLLPDTAFNFQFIADAFAGAPSPPDTTSSSKPMKINLDALLLDKIRLVYKDTVTGNDMEVSIDHSLTKLNEFDPAHLRFHVASFQVRGLHGRVWQGSPLVAATGARAGSPAGAGANGNGPSALANSSPSLQLRLGKIEIAGSSLDYRNSVAGLYNNVQLGYLLTEVKDFDIDKQVISLKELVLDSTTAGLRLGKIAVAGKNEVAGKRAPGGKAEAVREGSAEASSSGGGGGWRFLVTALRLDGDNIRFDDDNKVRQKEGMDYAHLDIRQLTLHGSSLSYTGDSVSGALTKGSFSEQSGFQLTGLQTRFLYSAHRSWLQGLLLTTPGTIVQHSATIQYSSLAGMMKDPAHTLIDLDLPNSRVQVKDILVFVPSLRSQPAFSHPQETWLVNARVKGSLDDLTIQTFQFSGLQDIHADLSGIVLHPMDANRINADLHIRQLSGSRQTLVSLLPKGTLPSNISIPGHFALSGKVNGGMEGFQSDLVLNTSSGSVLLKGVLRQFRQPKQAEYDLVFQTRSLDLGYILKDPAQYGRLTSEFTVKGKSFDLPTANAVFTGRIDTAVFRHYSYRGLLLDGSVADQHAELKSSISDVAVRFKLEASADLQRKFPALKLEWQIDTLDLHALNIVKDTMQFKGHIHADFADTNPDSLQGDLKLDKLVFVQGVQRFATDSITLVATRKGDIEDIQLHSEMADLDMNGRYKLTETGAALQHTINHYFDIISDSTANRKVAGDSTNTASSGGRASNDSIFAAGFDRNVSVLSAGHAASGQSGSLAGGGGAAPPVSSARRDTTGSARRDTTGSARRDTAATRFTPQDWTLRAHLRVSPLVLAYMPTLKGTDTLGAFISFNSDRNDLHLFMRDPHINIGQAQILSVVSVTAGTTGMGSGNGKLAYDVKIDGGHGSGFEIHQTSLSGFVQRDQLFADLLLKDAKGKDRYRLVGRLDKQKDGVKFQLNPDSLLLNYEKWRVGRDNYFQTGSAGIVVHDLTISNGNDSLSVNSNPPTPNAPIDVRFANFRLGTLSRFVEQDSLGLDGMLNGQAQVKNLKATPIFTSDLLVKSLSFKKDTLGDLAIKVNNEKANAYAADISLEGHNNDIKVKGEYFSGESRMNINLNLGQVSLPTFNHVAESVVQDMKGYLKGQLAISGSFDKPLIKGNLHFDSARITPVVSGEPLRLSKDNIEFDQDGFNFSQFALQDSAGNKLTVDGNVYTHDYKTYSFDISVNAGNFRLVNAPEDNSRQFYGSLNLDAAANLTGSMDDLKVDGDLRVNKKTNFYFVLPGSDPEVVDRLGVIRFIDRSQPGDTLVDRAAQQLRAKNSAIKGMDIALNIQTDSSAIFTVVIDERTGDALNIRGRSNLVFGMDKSGKTDLTGSYEVESGSYNLSLDVLKRKFDIQRGSSITWTGDPKTATLDINATYTANTPSIDLIANEVAGRPPADVNKFNQKLPFLVTLKMEGELLKPKITFDITLPANTLTLWPDVDQKLQQIRNEESELNKQVFALLLLNRFVGEDPLQSQAGGGSTLGNMAFQSASQILTNQMDNLAGSLIKGVDIHFDLNNQQDFSTGTESDYTELNVSVSKRLFNDRITVNVGSNFDVQGTNNPGQNASNLAGDVAVDYRLTKDGRYMVRAYRKNQYEAVVEGQVVETGVSFILTFDYNKLKELFGKTKEEKLQERKVTHPSGTGPKPTGDQPNSTSPTGKPGSTSTSSTGKSSNP